MICCSVRFRLLLLNRHQFWISTVSIRRLTFGSTALPLLAAAYLVTLFSPPPTSLAHIPKIRLSSRESLKVLVSKELHLALPRPKAAIAR